MSGVAYLTEQSQRAFRADAEAAGILRHPGLHVLFRSEAAGSWPDIVADVLARVQACGLDLLIIDTADVWMFEPGDDPNDAVVSEAAVRALQPLVETNVAIVLVRHERKAGGDIADSGRGSSAIAGAVDALLTLKRVQGGGHENRRELECVARAALPDAPRKLIIELVEAEYKLVGMADDVERQNARARILDILPASRETAIGAKAVQDRAGTARSMTQLLLCDLAESGAIRREYGAGGVRSNAYGYWLPPSPEHHDGRIRLSSG